MDLLLANATLDALVVGLDRCGVVTQWGAACARLTGHEASTAVGAVLWELPESPEEAARIERGLHPLVADGHGVKFTAPWTSTDGIRRTFALAGSAAPDDEGFAVVGVEVAPEEASSTILEDRRIFAALVENSSDFIGIADPAGTPVYLNPAGRRMVGFGPDFPIETTQILEYYPEDQHDFVQTQIMPTVMTEGQWRGETYFRHWTTGQAIPVSDEHFVITAAETGEVLGLGTITRDISEIRQAREDAEAANTHLRAANEQITVLYEKAREIDALKTEFFHNISHEFRTPLTLILGPLEAMVSDPAHPAPLRSSLAHALRNALRLLRLVNDLLDFSRTEEGRMVGQFVPTDLGQYTNELASAFKSAFAEAGLSFVVDCPCGGEPAWVDAMHWERIVLNLLSNALKFTQRGEVIARVRRTPGGFELVVKDTGTGIPEDDLPRVFDRFHRVAAPNARSHEGTGIGLALARELVLLHGGTIHAASRLGEGSQFTVTLPYGSDHLPADQIVEQRALPQVTRAAAHLEEARAWHQGAAPGAAADAQVDGDERPTVLIADDNADMRSYLTGVLTPHFAVREASDGAVALAAISERAPDVLVSDVMMPNIDGIELVSRLRQDPATRTLPVILLSARAGSEAAIHGLGVGADDYVAKPFTAQELLARVRAQIRMARARAELAEELIRTNRELEAFAACAAHDLRAPLRTVTGFGDLLLADYSDALDDEGRSFVAHMVRGARHMEVLIEDLLALSRVSQAELKLQRVDLSCLAHDVVDRLRGADPDRAVTASIAADLEVNADPGLMSVLMQNVIGNAWNAPDRSDDRDRHPDPGPAARVLRPRRRCRL